MTEPRVIEPHLTESQDDEVADLVSKIAEQVAREEQEEASLYSGPEDVY